MIQWTVTVDATGLIHIRDSLARYRPQERINPWQANPSGLFSAGPRASSSARERIEIPDPTAHAQVEEMIDGAVEDFKTGLYDAAMRSDPQRVTLTLNLEQMAALNHTLMAGKNAPVRQGGKPGRLIVWATEALSRLPSVGDLISAIGSIDTIGKQIDL